MKNSFASFLLTPGEVLQFVVSGQKCASRKRVYLQNFVLPFAMPLVFTDPEVADMFQQEVVLTTRRIQRAMRFEAVEHAGLARHVLSKLGFGNPMIHIVNAADSNVWTGPFVEDMTDEQFLEIGV